MIKKILQHLFSIKFDKPTAICISVLYNILALTLFYNKTFLFFVKHIYYNGCFRIEILSIISVIFIYSIATIIAFYAKHFAAKYC